MDRLCFTPSSHKPKTAISLRIPSALLDRIDALCGQLSMTRTDLILQCIVFAVEHLKESFK